MSFSAFPLDSTVRGFCRPGGILSPKKNEPKNLNLWSKRYFVTLLFPLFLFCTLLQFRLPGNRLIDNEARNIDSGYVNNEGKTITCASIAKDKLKTIYNNSNYNNKNNIRVSLPKGTKPKRSQYPNWYCN